MTNSEDTCKINEIMILLKQKLIEKNEIEDDEYEILQ